MNKKMIDDFLKNNPDLDRNKLENIINLLKKHNPNIRVSNKFKKDLKIRLNTIIEYKKKPKKMFFWKMYFTPILSLFLIICGSFYIYKDINLINKNAQYNNIYNSEVIKKVPNVRINEESNMKKEFKGFNKIEKPQIISRKPIDLEVETVTTVEVDIQEVENSEIIDVLGNNFDNEISSYGNESIPNNMIETRGTNTLDEEEKQLYLNTFVDYCEENNSEILTNNESIQYCIIGNELCLISNYKNNICKLVKKK